jgi:type I restriction-modification system DNA methylase subunit
MKFKKSVTVRFTEDDYQKYLSIFSKLKSTNNYTQSNFIRDCVFKTVPPTIEQKVKPTTCEIERIKQLSSLMNSINQIARNLNTLQKYNQLKSEKIMMHYLKQLDTVANYCKSAMYEE